MAIYYQNIKLAINHFQKESVRMKKFLVSFAILTVAAVAAVRFTTYADAGITTTIPPIRPAPTMVSITVV